MTDGIAQTRTDTYLSVNVYRGKGRWICTVLEREPGKPYPRLVQTLGTKDLGPDTAPLREALQAASDALLWYAENRA